MTNGFLFKAAIPSSQSAKTRRTRFLWTADYDELAWDAAAILAVRCRQHPRMDWTAIEQVFPGASKNRVRQHIAKYRSNPAGQAYLERLEEAWLPLWLAYRGTPELPDDHPDSASDFDITSHIAFLRQKIDKK